MNIKPFEKPMQCVNCGCGIIRIRKKWVAAESEELQQLLSEWTCRELEDYDTICPECYNLLNFSLQNEDKSRKFGHKQVCMMCGHSILKAKSIPLDEHPELKVYVVQWVPPHLVKLLENICKRCYVKAESYKKLCEEQNSESNEVNNDVCNEVNNEDHEVIVNTEPTNCHSVEIKVEPLDALGYGELDIPASDPEDNEEEKELVPAKNTTITLSKYKRAADSSARCVFKHCKSPYRSKFPQVLIERLLIDYSFYIPPHARVCDEHSVNSHQEWAELVNNYNITDFTVTHIENLMSILKNCKHNSYCSNFDTAIEENEYLCQYWLGVNFQAYEDMLKSLNQYKKSSNHMVRLNKALAIYLMKKHTGFSEEKLALFFNIHPPKLMINLINRIQGYLETKVKVHLDHTYVAMMPNN